MNVIYKYHLLLTGRNIGLPVGSQVVNVGEQEGKITLWIEEEYADMPVMEDRHFLVYATGEPFNPTNKTHVGTALVGEYVWHVYEVVK